MSRDFELDPVERLTTGAVGEPGQRTFFIQGSKGDTLVSLVVEKQQVAVLSEQIAEFLARLPGGVGDDPTDEEIDEQELELQEPIEPEFRVGPMALGYEPERGLIVLQCEEYIEGQGLDDEDDDDDDDDDDDVLLPTGPGATVRFWATTAQMRALARRGIAVVAAGRPVCAACGSAIEEGGHFCPPSNGHRKIKSLPETRDP